MADNKELAAESDEADTDKNEKEETLTQLACQVLHDVGFPHSTADSSKCKLDADQVCIGVELLGAAQIAQIFVNLIEKGEAGCMLESSLDGVLIVVYSLQPDQVG